MQSRLINFLRRLVTLLFVNLLPFRREAQQWRRLQTVAKGEQRQEAEVLAEILDFALDHKFWRDKRRRVWFALSPRERQVTRLVCKNFTNRKIGQELCISPETVRSHLRNVYGKFGVAGRQELCRLMADFEFPEESPGDE
jgi:DNA-binding CsgD family transcriptional regulator